MFSSGEMMTGVRLALSLLALAAGCCAQRTWVVDAKNGAGADFVDFPAALDAARPGDTISLRVGMYRGGTVSRGVLIRPETLGQLVFLSTNLSIANLPRSQVLHIKRIKFGPGDLRITNCRGTVRLEEVSTSTGPRLIVLDSAHVELSEAGADVPWIVERSHLQMSFGGLWAGNLPFAARIKDSTIIMVDAAISGKWGFVDLRCRITQQPGMAVHATNSVFVLAGSSGIWGGIAARPGFCGNRKVAPSIAGTNNVVWMDSKIVHNSLGDNPVCDPNGQPSHRSTSTRAPCGQPLAGRQLAPRLDRSPQHVCGGSGVAPGSGPVAGTTNARRRSGPGHVRHRVRARPIDGLLGRSDRVADRAIPDDLPNHQVLATGPHRRAVDLSGSRLRRQGHGAVDVRHIDDDVIQVFERMVAAAQ